MREFSPYDADRHIDRPQVSSDSLSDSLKKLSLLLKYLKRYKFKSFLAFLSMVVASMIVLIFGKAMQSLIDKGYIFDESFSFLWMVVGCFLCVVLLSICSFLRLYVVSWLSERIITDLRENLFKHLIYLDMSYFDSMKASEIVSRLTTDTSLIQIVLGTALPIAIRNLLLFVGGLILMFLTSVKLSTYTLIFVPFLVFPLKIFGKRVKEFSKKAQSTIGDLSAFLDETFSSIKTVQAFSHEKYDIKLLRHHGEKTFKAANKRSLQRALLSAVSMSISFGAVCALLIIGIYEVQENILTSGVLSSFLFYAALVATSLGSFSEVFSDMKRASGALDRLFEIFKIHPSIINKRSKNTLFTPRGTVAMHNVCFAYPISSHRKVLDHVTLSAVPGENIAIVGPSGAGKTTLFSLLLRFYDPQSGTIYIDGADCKDLSLEELRSRISLVSQEPSLFSATLYDNILYGNPKASDKEIWKACETAQLLNVIEKLPHGINTHIGVKGIQLSGGQKQRVALARAILRDPRILLLDEATSALDAENEHAVQQALKYLMSTRTTLVIAHRLSTVLHAHKIYVLNNGKVEDCGTHAELCDKNKLYRRLATLQFADPI